MLEATIEWMGYAMYTQLYTGRQPQRMGLSHSSIAPYDGFPTADGQMLIGVQNDRGWRTLVRDVLDVPELAEDPRFATNVARVENRAACDAAVGEQTARWPSDELAERLAAAGIPAAQVKDVDAVVEHPQLHGARPLADDRHRAQPDPRAAAAGDVRRRRGAHGRRPRARAAHAGAARRARPRRRRPDQPADG